MNGPHEDRAHQDPDKSGDPAPDNGDCRPHDGARAGNGREVMSEEDGLLCGDIIDIVAELVAGANSVRVELEYSSPQVFSIGMIRNDVEEPGSCGWNQ